MSPRIPLWLGMFMVLASIPMMMLSVPFAFSVTSLAWGSILVALDQFYGYRLEKKKLENRHAEFELMRTRLRSKHLLHVAEQGDKLLAVGDPEEAIIEK